MQHLQVIRGDEEYLKYLVKLKRINLLILDDFGVSPLKAAEARDLLKIVEDRVKQSSLIITFQLPINSEKQLIDDVIAKGYNLYIVYIDLSDPLLNVQRVRAKVQNKGHFVDPAIVVKRYYKSMQQIIEVAPKVKALYLFDKSRKTESWINYHCFELSPLGG